jgi:hypothetical protein
MRDAGGKAGDKQLDRCRAGISATGLDRLVDVDLMVANVDADAITTEVPGDDCAHHATSPRGTFSVCLRLL